MDVDKTEFALTICSVQRGSIKLLDRNAGHNMQFGQTLGRPQFRKKSAKHVRLLVFVLRAIEPRFGIRLSMRHKKKHIFVSADLRSLNFVMTARAVCERGRKSERCKHIDNRKLL